MLGRRNLSTAAIRAQAAKICVIIQLCTSQTKTSFSSNFSTLQPSSYAFNGDGDTCNINYNGLSEEKCLQMVLG